MRRSPVRSERARLLGFVILSLTSGCANESPPWHGDETFTPEERAQIETGLAFVSSRVDDHTPRIIWDAPHAEGPCPVATVCRREELPGFTGFYSPAPAIDLVPVSCLDVNAAHEFGHWYGYRDHDGPGVMNPKNPKPELVWTEEDARSKP